ncbi:polysaccharide deacetylase [Mesorhizobium sp. SB112]|uniref:polysaccharide deacetylase family protein n=1 Tax=Mesorhizobium sp. SB112 TaxID=3151853 RepID=UPI0032648924
MTRIILTCITAAALLATSSSFATAQPSREPQYVIVSFDGAHDLRQWQRSRTLAALTGARFTYFLSCVFLLSPETKSTYHAPGKRAGRSNVGFAQSKQEVKDRLSEIWLAKSEGHDIASHGCGHFDGKDWTKADWTKEFTEFTTILRDAYTINGIKGEPEGWKDFAESEIKGFRAPYLATGKALNAALSDAGFTYDASGVSRGPAEPVSKGGLSEFSLPLIPEGPRSRPVIAMDYNLYVRHSGGEEDAANSAIYEQRAYDAFRKAFDAEHDGKRVPLQIGFHFTLMNDGAYWRALERFAKDVCVMEDVACISYADYLARQK